MSFAPHVTVSATIHKEQRFLVVEEKVRDRIVFNNPAGHLEAGESLEAAITREVLEETACQFTPTGITGAYLWQNPDNGDTFLRINFIGEAGEPDSQRALDADIIATHWLSREELFARVDQLRSPMVLQCIDDCLAGKHYSLDCLNYLGSAGEAGE